MRLLFVMMLMLVATSQAVGADPVGKVEAKLGADEDLWIGQRVPLTVKILAPGFSIEGVPAFDIPEIPGLLSLKLPGSPTLGNETVQDVTYVTQVHEFALFPQRAGEFTVPAFAVRFASSAGFGKPVTPFNVKTEPLQFAARLPPGAEGLRTLISTNRLTLEESWSPDTRSVKVGDAITRTITMKANDIPGMEFPPLTFEPIEGVGVYPKQPSVTDASERGSLAGQRVESVTCVFEQPGTFTLPGLSLTWWKLDEKVLKQAAIAGRTISVTSAVHPAETTAGSPADTRISPWMWPAGVAVVLGLMVFVVTLLRRQTPARVDEAATRFAALETACRTNDCRRILAALTAWLDHRDTSSRPVAVSQWAVESGDKELIELINRLEADLFQHPSSNPNAPFPGRELLACVRRLRHRQTHPHHAHARNTSLAPLNPL